MKTIIHVNQHVIASNRKTGAREPPLTVKTYKSNVYADEVEILGPSKVVHSPHKPLPCGARVWVETNAEVRILRLDGREQPSKASVQVPQGGQVRAEVLPPSADHLPKPLKPAPRRDMVCLRCGTQMDYVNGILTGCPCPTPSDV